MNHQRLRVYGLLIDSAKRVPDIVDKMPKGYSWLKDELERALGSAIFNLAEGNGRTSKKERARFFDISLASLAEASSEIDVMRAYRLISKESGIELKRLFEIAYSMIFNLKKS